MPICELSLSSQVKVFKVWKLLSGFLKHGFFHQRQGCKIRKNSKSQNLELLNDSAEPGFFGSSFTWHWAEGARALCTLTNPPSTDNLPWTLKLFGLGSWVGQGGCQGACLCFRTHFLIKIQVHSDGEPRKQGSLKHFLSLNRLLQLKISV